VSETPDLPARPSPPSSRSSTPRLWPIGWALAGIFGTTLLVLAGITTIVAAVLGFPHLAPTKSLDINNQFDLLKIILSVVAGIGAIVALVVAYRRQRVLERTAELDEGKEQREITRLFTERFTTIASQLGDDAPAVRLAGVYAMAGLADDWESQRQTCIDVLCAYLRMPYPPDPGPKGTHTDRISWQREREVRHTVVDVIGTHLQASSAVSWEGYYFDFKDVVFDGGDLRFARFSKGGFDFDRALFQSGTLDFTGGEFSGAHVSFYRASFVGGEVLFTNAKFSGSIVEFHEAEFKGSVVWFDDAEFSAGTVDFGDISFTAGEVLLNSYFTGSQVRFGVTDFVGGQLSFAGSFSGGKVSIGGCTFCGAKVDFSRAFFEEGGKLQFDHCYFSQGPPIFSGAIWKGGVVSFLEPRDWSAPPIFDSWEKPPIGLELPESKPIRAT
jgi:uncharacterized protein YjbI with pentapeptide repeats